MTHAGLQAVNKTVCIDVPVCIYIYDNGIAFIILLYFKLYIKINFFVA
jgi:hypothetical protein